MIVTVLFSDSSVTVDGVARIVEMPASDPNWRVIQYNGDHKFLNVEVNEGPQLAIRDHSFIHPYVAAWTAAAPEKRTPLKTGARAKRAKEM